MEKNTSKDDAMRQHFQNEMLAKSIVGQLSPKETETDISLLKEIIIEMKKQTTLLEEIKSDLFQNLKS